MTFLVALSPAPVDAAAVPVLIAYVVFAVVSAILAVIDARTHRLPNRIVLPCYPVGLGLFALGGLAGRDGAALLRAVLAMATLFAFYLLLRIVQPQGLGGGDVKLAGVIGLHLGWIGWDAVLLGSIAAFVLAGAYALLLLVLRRVQRRTSIAFGPFLLAGAWLAIGMELAGAGTPPLA